jgi:rare lipoprotein A
VVAHAAFTSHDNNAATTKTAASQGLASFYSEGTQTASGEKFDANELTAAHPTLPFGTKLRVTNVTNGQSVTVRVNDRGPYVPGRVVDVSYSAARTLGMVGGGVAKVKLDVVQ